MFHILRPFYMFHILRAFGLARKKNLLSGCFYDFSAHFRYGARLSHDVTDITKTHWRSREAWRVLTLLLVSRSQTGYARLRFYPNL